MSDRLAGAVTWRELGSSGLVRPFLGLCFAVWLHAASSMLAATTLPRAVEELGGAHLIAWAFTLYQLGSILAGAGAGLLAGRIGLRRGLLGAAALYGLGCAVCAAAPAMDVVLAGRLLQGTGGGMLVALTYVALSRDFPARLMPRLMALVSVTWSSSAFCGPLIGGTFATFGLWRFGFWAFAVQAGIFIAWEMTTLTPDRPRAPAPGSRFPLRRLAVLSAAVMSFAVAGAAVDIVLSPVLCLAGLALLWLFVRLDRARPASRMFPAGTLDLSSRTGAGLYMVFAAGAATMSFLVYGPILLETLYGITPLAAGYIVAVESLAWGTAAFVFSGFDDRAETWLIRVGTAVVSLGVLGFAVAMPSGHLWAVVACAAAQGAGFGIMWGYLVRHIVASAPAAETAVAATSVPTTQQIGFAIGAALAGIVANLAGFAAGVSPGAAASVAFWVFAAFIPLAGFANIAAWRLTGQARARS